ncbi:MAG TPA: L-threonylcarbamoyladenylate synthase [Gemmatimonadaceae bacterium]|nr:L-threonylcarbamoyladenylate synthase [Gemmatimonadaceae bacterium]
MEAPAVDTARIAQAVGLLKQGGLVAVPTETVYGLAADASNEAAVRAMFAAKGRPADHPVIVHVADAGAIDAWAREVPDSARALAAAFWPGPLTLVLKRSPKALDVVTGGQDTVGLRCPAHPWARALLQAFGGAVAAPSANSFGRLSPTAAEHVRVDLGEKPAGKVDMILDGGACPIGIESTIVDLSGDRPTLLRPGSITRLALEQVLGGPVAEPGGDAPRASGRLERHYAPRTPLEVVPVDRLGSRLAALFHLRVAVLAPAAVLQTLRAQPAFRLSAPEDPVAYARDLYANLHRLDEAGAERIVVAAPPAGGEWDAIHDRLKRARSDSRPPG